MDFKIYNYAEFFTAVTKYTDVKGATFLTAGLGDMIVWASKNGKYGYKKVTFGKDREVTIALDRDNDAVSSVDMAIAAAQGVAQRAEVSASRLRPTRRVLLPRTRYAMRPSVARITRRTARRSMLPISLRAKGNWRTIEAFLNRHSDNEARALNILNTLSDKDLRDILPQILEDCFANKSDQVSPRVEDEMLITPFKCFFENYFDRKTVEKFRANPMEIANWIKKNIRLNPDTKALQIAQTPVGAVKFKITDERSRKVLFVDIARSLNIEAKRDTVTGALMYRKNGNWTTVDFEAKGTVTPHQGTLVLTYQPAAHLDNPLYYNHFSLSRLENGTATLLNYDEGGDGGQTSWMNTFKDGCPLEAGTYLLTTGTRLANGSVLSHSEFFVIKEGQTTTVPLIMRESKDEVQVIGSFNSESKFDMDGNQVSLLSQTGRGYYIIGLIGVGQEPTNHALVDIAKEADAFDRWGRPMVLLFENAEEAKKFDASLYGRLPKNIIYGIDTDGAIRQQMVENLKLSSKTQLPIFFIADTFNRVVFSSQGYTIGLGEQLKNTFNPSLILPRDRASVVPKDK